MNRFAVPLDIALARRAGRWETLAKAAAGATQRATEYGRCRIGDFMFPSHAPASMAAFRAGKHVYYEKPLTRSIHEARRSAKAAREGGSATQMGNEAHSGCNYRRVVELIRSGAMGQVTEVHC